MSGNHAAPGPEGFPCGRGARYIPEFFERAHSVGEDQRDLGISDGVVPAVARAAHAAQHCVDVDDPLLVAVRYSRIHGAALYRFTDDS